MTGHAENVIAFYNKWGTCEQWIKEGKGPIKGRDFNVAHLPQTPSAFASSARLQSRQLPARVGDARADPVADEPQEEADKIHATVSRDRHIAFQTAEVAAPGNLFVDILRLIEELRPSSVAPTVSGNPLSLG